MMDMQSITSELAKDFCLLPKDFWMLVSTAIGHSLHNRNNNPIKRYNYTLKGKFPLAHPNLAAFINMIEEEGCYHVQRKTKATKGVMVPGEANKITICEVPAFYARLSQEFNRTD